MDGQIKSLAFAVGLLFMAAASPSSQAPATVIAGLDHIPLAVRDLDAASDTYRRLGFALKPGTAHQNGIRNNHVKFPDGSGIELITAPAAVDPLTTRYRAMLDVAEGPAFWALHARDTDALVGRLGRGGFAFTRDGGTVNLAGPALGFLFFVRDNRSPTDGPEHFAHSNGARAMVRVWVAADDGDELRRLLVAMGGTATTLTVEAPRPTTATVVKLENGDAVILPASRQVTKGRPVMGATFEVADATALAARFTSAHVAFAASPRRLIVSPDQTHGIWLEFVESR
jgi:catechol 2,3-dioxygenase-like lactoylglutathione lyase family enzyme